MIWLIFEFIVWISETFSSNFLLNSCLFSEIWTKVQNESVSNIKLKHLLCIIKQTSMNWHRFVKSSLISISGISVFIIKRIKLLWFPSNF